ncbi:MAG TPA: DUF2975 domain-containing protein [Terricaulis sp.]|nr:DUF2975 domain-containing protein [Terricaulis sp.]HRP11883.1 DUF2975 domain-containing protein [Terricaulis sp.]
MNTAIAAPLARAQQLAQASSVVAVIAAIMLAITAALDVAAPGLRALPDLAPGLEGTLALLHILGAQAILALPSFILAGVCFDLSRVLRAYAAGHIFTRRASAGVRKAGEGILWAMAFKCLLSPALYSIVAEHARGNVFNLRFETFDLGLIALGFFIMVMGRVLQAAAALKAENDEIV